MGDVALTLAMRPVTLCFQGLAAALTGKCIGLQMTSPLIQRTKADLDCGRFCGSTGEYCLSTHGCQSGCWSGSSSPTASPTSTTTTTPAPAASTLTTGQKTGIIAGVFLFLALVLIVAFLWKRHHGQEISRRERENIARIIPSSVTLHNPIIFLDPNNPNLGHMMRRIANGNRANSDPPQILPPPRAYNPHSGGPPSYTSLYVHLSVLTTIYGSLILI
jgi:hypothetical protein